MCFKGINALLPKGCLKYIHLIVYIIINVLFYQFLIICCYIAIVVIVVNVVFSHVIFNPITCFFSESGNDIYLIDDIALIVHKLP